MSTTRDLVGTQTSLAALTGSSQRLRELVEALPVDELSRPSFAADWSIAQVLSHLGSAAEICTTLVERALVGDTSGPQHSQVEPVWRRWDAMSAAEQRAEWYLADSRHLQVLRSITDEQAASLQVPYFSGPLRLADYTGYRLSEQAVHGWDVAVALDPAAVIREPELGLLWERIDVVASRFLDGASLQRLRPQAVDVQLSDTAQHYSLQLDAEVHLLPAGGPSATGQVYGSADAVLRLVYGRVRPSDRIEVTGSVTRDDLIALFPGYRAPRLLSSPATELHVVPGAAYPPQTTARATPAHGSPLGRHGRTQRKRSTMSTDLTGSTALVTGGNSGIGRATARELAQHGAHVIITGRDITRGDQIVTEIRAGGDKADFIAAELTDEAGARDLARQATERAGGHLDILVNNAGVFPFGPTDAHTEADFDAVYAVNVKVPFFLVAEIAPAMAARGKGSIINVTTMVAQFGQRGMALYGSSKAALTLLTKAWAAEYGPSGVRVNAVSPGPTRTEGTAVMGDALDQLASTIPHGKPGMPEDIAHAITYLAGDDAAYVYGAILPVDGGRIAT